MKPVRFFLSHQNAARPAVIELETAMRRRGIASWRDRKDQTIGHKTYPMIERAIDHDTDGFALFGSEHVLDSEYVWTIEWPRAVERHAKEEASSLRCPYPIVPLFVDGLAPAALETAAATFGVSSPVSFDGEFLASSDATSVARVARRLLRTAISRRTSLYEPDRPLHLHLATFEPPAGLDSDLLIDWTADFADGPTPWPELLAALDDLKAELARADRSLHITTSARLPAAFALGHAFPPPSRIAISAGPDGWKIAPRGSCGSPIVVEREERPSGNPTVAIVKASFTRDVHVLAEEATTRLSLNPAMAVRLGLSDGAGAVNAQSAAAAAAVFGQELRSLGDAGVLEVHLFIAAPADLALLLGAAVNAGPAMTAYYLEDVRHYARSVTLRS